VKRWTELTNFLSSFLRAISAAFSSLFIPAIGGAGDVAVVALFSIGSQPSDSEEGETGIDARPKDPDNDVSRIGTVVFRDCVDNVGYIGCDGIPSGSSSIDR
jgi:hypothetical protein